MNNSPIEMLNRSDKVVRSSRMCFFGLEILHICDPATGEFKMGIYRYLLLEFFLF